LVSMESTTNHWLQMDLDSLMWKHNKNLSYEANELGLIIIEMIK
jgi:hypothetical protein